MLWFVLDIWYTQYFPGKNSSWMWVTDFSAPVSAKKIAVTHLNHNNNWILILLQIEVLEFTYTYISFEDSVHVGKIKIAVRFPWCSFSKFTVECIVTTPFAGQVRKFVLILPSVSDGRFVIIFMQGQIELFFLPCHLLLLDFFEPPSK